MTSLADTPERGQQVLTILETLWPTWTGKRQSWFASSGFGNVYLEFEPVPDLVLRSSIGGNFNSFYTWSYFARTYENSENNSAVTTTKGLDKSLGGPSQILRIGKKHLTTIAWTYW
jgi:hypothetical protein